MFRWQSRVAHLTAPAKVSLNRTPAVALNILNLYLIETSDALAVRAEVLDIAVRTPSPEPGCAPYCSREGENISTRSHRLVLTSISEVREVEVEILDISAREPSPEPGCAPYCSREGE